MEQKSEEKQPLKAPNSPPPAGRDTLYLPASVEKEWKELSAKFKNVPFGFIRKNPEICAEVIETVMENSDLDGFLRKMSRGEFEKALKNKVKKEIRPSLYEGRKMPVNAFEVQLPDSPARELPADFEKQKGCCQCGCCIL